MRLEVTRRSDLATRALLLLNEGKKMKALELARDLDASAGFLTQALTPLVTAGWIRSDPGPTGGYSLQQDLRMISVLDVVEAIEGPTDVASCVLEDRPCNGAGPGPSHDSGHCAMHESWVKARSHLLADLAKTPLSTVAERRSAR